MKPEYLQSKVEELARDRDAMKEIIIKIEMDITFLEDAVGEIQDTLVMMQDKLVINKVSDEEKHEFKVDVLTEIGKHNACELSRHEKHIAVDTGDAICKAVNDAATVLRKYVDDSVADKDYAIELLKKANNQSTRAIWKIIDIIDPKSNVFTDKNRPFTICHGSERKRKKQGGFK